MNNYGIKKVLTALLTLPLILSTAVVHAEETKPSTNQENYDAILTQIIEGNNSVVEEKDNMDKAKDKLEAIGKNVSDSYYPYEPTVNTNTTYEYYINLLEDIRDHTDKDSKQYQEITTKINDAKKYLDYQKVVDFSKKPYYEESQDLENQYNNLNYQFEKAIEYYEKYQPMYEEYQPMYEEYQPMIKEETRYDTIEDSSYSLMATEKYEGASSMHASNYRVWNNDASDYSMKISADSHLVKNVKGYSKMVVHHQAVQIAQKIESMQVSVEQKSVLANHIETYYFVTYHEMIPAPRNNETRAGVAKAALEKAYPGVELTKEFLISEYKKIKEEIELDKQQIAELQEELQLIEAKLQEESIEKIPLTHDSFNMIAFLALLILSLTGVYTSKKYLFE